MGEAGKAYRLQLGHPVWGMDEAPSPVGIAVTLQEVGMFIGVAGVGEASGCRAIGLWACLETGESLHELSKD